MDEILQLITELSRAIDQARNASPIRVATIFATAPLTITLDGVQIDSIGCYSTYTPVIGHVVEVGVLRGASSVQYIVHARIV